MTKSYLGAYWGARAETADQCAGRITEFLNAMTAIDPLLTEWRGKGRSRRDALTQPLVTAERADLVARLHRGRNRRDVGNEIIEELGYAVSWWNSRDNKEGGVTLRLHLGVTTEFVGNSVVLHFPESTLFPSLYDQTVASTLLLSVISIFEPERAVWSSSDLTKVQSEPDQVLDGGGITYGKLIGHAAGWANYLSDADDVKFDTALLPHSATVTREGGGTLVRLGNNPAEPPLDDVLAVRIAMGYAVSADSMGGDGGAAASAATSGAGSGLAPVETKHLSDAAEGTSRKPLPLPDEHKTS